MPHANGGQYNWRSRSLSIGLRTSPVAEVARSRGRQPASLFRPLRSLAGTGSDEGAVTAEFAVVLPAVMAMAVLLMMLARAVTVEMNCQDAASAAARVAVVSNSDSEARLAARDAAGGDASVSISRGFKQVNVTVSCRVVPDPMHVLPMAVVGKATGVMQ